MPEIRIPEGIPAPSTWFLERESDQSFYVAHPNDVGWQDLPDYIAIGPPTVSYWTGILNAYDILERVESNDVRTVDDVCGMLSVWGNDALADRIAYFASDDDLSDGDIPLTDASARGFLSFFGKVESEGKVRLTCSPEGWLCAGWRFPDERRATLWFMNDTEVMFAATGADGDFLEIDGGREVGRSLEIMGKLVGAGLLKWSLDSRNFHITTMLRDTAVSETSPKMEHRWKAHFYSGTMNSSFRLTGVNTSAPWTAEPKLTTLLSH